MAATEKILTKYPPSHSLLRLCTEFCCTVDLLVPVAFLGVWIPNGKMMNVVVVQGIGGATVHGACN